MPTIHKAKPFLSAKTEVKKLAARDKGKIWPSDSYQLAFHDQNFLLRRSLRPVRLQLELLKAELIQHHERIESTVVFFGSVRINDHAKAKLNLALVRRELKRKPNDKNLQRKVGIAESLLEKSYYYEQARKLAYIISKTCQKTEARHFVIVTGGGPGIMEAGNRGAHDAKAKSIGHTIALPQLTAEPPNRYISPNLCFQFHYFAIRKMHLLIRAKAAVFFPGGYGTFDELFEVLTLLQMKKIKPMPILLFGKDYWHRMVNFNGLVEEGMISPGDLSLFKFVETAEEAWEIIRKFYKLKK